MYQLRYTCFELDAKEIRPDEVQVCGFVKLSLILSLNHLFLLGYMFRHKCHHQAFINCKNINCLTLNTMLYQCFINEIAVTD
jgi:hypothetical protein